ncbi:MAG: hypothetical protein AAFU77_04185 [Myxococcota bacterium]
MKETIEVGRSVGPLVFGLAREEVLSLLGTPSAEYKDIDAIFYDDPFMLCGFDSATDRLTSVEVTPASGFKLNDKELPASFPALRRLLSKEGVSLVAEKSDPDLHFDPKLRVMVFVQEGAVDAVSFGVLFDEAGDTILWPEDHPTS